TMAVLSDDLSKGMENAIDNRLMLVSSTGDVVWQHSKSILVPGPETLMTLPGDSTLKAGDLGLGRVSGAICYEMDFPEYIRQSAELRSELFLTPANDWKDIKRTHAKMARLRAVENGTALLRVASRGLSQAVDPVGRVQAEWDYFEDSGVFKATVSIGHVLTIYRVIGDGLASICVLGSLLLIGLSMFRGWRERRMK
ncbi:MAG: hypothetical protein KAU21_01015, partial [Gammaproteobacteria bacterium]|nr:hypothetical protein [Gammaproteobacteria bacterium]